MKKTDEITMILIEMGFAKITSNQFSHPKYGYIHLQNFTHEEIAHEIFKLGRMDKAVEIKKCLLIQD